MHVLYKYCIKFESFAVHTIKNNFLINSYTFFDMQEEDPSNWGNKIHQLKKKNTLAMQNFLWSKPCQFHYSNLDDDEEAWSSWKLRSFSATHQYREELQNTKRWPSPCWTLAVLVAQIVVILESIASCKEEMLLNTL